MRRIAALIVSLAAVAGARSFTLEQVLAAPFPSEIVAPPGGGKVAWILNERGARNVWFATAPDYRGVRVTAYTEDDGQDLGELRWTPDGRALVYVRGGDLEFPGRAEPNPAANPAGVEQAIWMVVPGEKPRRIDNGHAPAIAPKGDRIAYLKGGQIWTAPLAGTDKPAQLFHSRAGVTAGQLQWSQDGARLAFVSDRSSHSFIAVYDFNNKSLGYLDASVDKDHDPVWSPDGKRVAFIREASGGGERRGARRDGEPWSIRVATVADGLGRQVWKADAGPGSVFRGVTAAGELIWGAGDRIVFPWEHTGWLQLYAAAAEGGPAAQLTAGNFEVEQVALSQDGKEIFYSSNQDDIDRRHIWRVAVEGGTPHAVTTGDGLEWSPAPAGNAMAFLHSDARRPARAAIQIGNETRDLAPDSIPAEFPGDSLVVPRQVIYNGSDGLAVHAQLFLPAEGKPGERHPALVFIHGGSRRQMLLGWHYMEYYNNAYGMNEYLASQGYVVLSINYRSGIGYGLNFREALNYGPTGASEFNDVEGAGLYLRGRPDVDPGHIGLWGGSYGGYLTALGLARASDLFAAGVDFHGVHDWAAPSEFSASREAVPDPARVEAARTAFESSPVADVKTWRSPVLLIHGDDDRNVDFDETVEMAAALRKQGVYFEQLIFPDEIHGFLRHDSWLRGYRATADFFKRKL